VTYVDQYGQYLHISSLHKCGWLTHNQGNKKWAKMFHSSTFIFNGNHSVAVFARVNKTIDQ
jgi:hypothetical protein